MRWIETKYGDLTLMVMEWNEYSHKSLATSRNEMFQLYLYEKRTLEWAVGGIRGQAPIERFNEKCTSFPFWIRSFSAKITWIKSPLDDHKLEPSLNKAGPRALKQTVGNVISGKDQIISINAKDFPSEHRNYPNQLADTTASFEIDWK